MQKTQGNMASSGVYGYSMEPGRGAAVAYAPTQIGGVGGVGELQRLSLLLFQKNYSKRRRFSTLPLKSNLSPAATSFL